MTSSLSSLPGAETASPTAVAEPRFRVRDYGVLLKPRVMSLVVFTAWVGLVLAPEPLPLWQAMTAVACIALAAGAAGAVNMWYDRDIDAEMARTRDRPLPAGRLAPRAALAFGGSLAVLSVATMAAVVNAVAAGLLALTVVYYVVIYTMWLKRRTPYNIVIGGAAGAFPPMVGWAAASGDIGLGSLTLFAIIFLWTPPHSWALALFRREDYERAAVPMLPVVAGERETRRQILVYTAILVPATFLPVAVGLAGAPYGVAAAVLGAGLGVRVLRLWRHGGAAAARALFFFSILYLFLIFVALLADHVVRPIL
jgi:protoheme IX farnesyltransferase